MAEKLDLLTTQGTYALYEVGSLGNQQAVIDRESVYVVDTGSQGYNIGVALAALGAACDLGLLAWPHLPESDWESIDLSPAEGVAARSPITPHGARAGAGARNQTTPRRWALRARHTNCSI